ncbi:hypothetical protein F5Y16DRAFT_395914 [Xylariaceae sp. FL0255]|nr:hypothetical protein F5Y16DRAFT_395914 [Xylariaceae sp. FL0255]
MSIQLGLIQPQSTKPASTPPFEAFYAEWQDFRVAKLIQGDWEDDIECTLHHASLILCELEPPFTALSYVWGTAKSKRPMQLNGRSYKITNNLDHALRTLRRQVLIMDKIYKRAEEVTVFLGGPRGHIWKLPPTSPDTKGMLHIQHFPRAAPAGTKSLDWYRLSQPASACEIFDFLALAREPHMRREIMDQLREDSKDQFLHLIEGIRDLATSPWWSRITWDFLFDAMERWAEGCLAENIRHEYGTVIQLLLRRTREIDQRRKAYRAPTSLDKSESLLPMLRTFSGRKASDDRDKIYALLGIFQGRTDIRPDYSQGVFEVYANTTLDILRNDDVSLRALSGDLARKSTYDLPSWIPDWAVVFDDIDRCRAPLTSLYEVCPYFKGRVCTSGDDFYENLNMLLDYVRAPRLDYVANFLRDLGEDFMRKRPLVIPSKKDRSEKKDRQENISLLLRSLMDQATTYSTARSILQPFRLSPIYMSKPGVLTLSGFQTDIVSKIFSPFYPLGLDSLPKEVAKYVRQTLDWVGCRNKSRDSVRLESLSRQLRWDPVSDAESTTFLRALVSDLVKDSNDGTIRRISSDDDCNIRALQTWFLNCMREEPTAQDEESIKLRDYDVSFTTANTRRCFFETNSGKYGWGPTSMKVGDDVFILSSANTPFILRQLEDFDSLGRMRPHYKLVGDCFLHDPINEHNEDMQGLTGPTLFDDEIKLNIAKWLESGFLSATFDEISKNPLSSKIFGCHVNHKALEEPREIVVIIGKYISSQKGRLLAHKDHYPTKNYTEEESRIEQEERACADMCASLEELRWVKDIVSEAESSVPFRIQLS